METQFIQPMSNLNPIGKKKIVFQKIISEKDISNPCDILSNHTGLSKTKIKDAMNKGAVWLTQPYRRKKRIRRATFQLKVGDKLELFYDEKLLALQPVKGVCLADMTDYSIWYKPPGLLTQGTAFGDHCSLLRQVDVFYQFKREVFLVHRLDREASGIVIVAHGKTAAQQLSALFRKKEITKQYLVEVYGKLDEKMQNQILTFPLDGKEAHTEFRVISYDNARNTSMVLVEIKTGRRHQIRRHFDMIGFPVMGDPLYGTGNKNTDGLKIVAKLIRFHCPLSQKEQVFDLDTLYPAYQWNM